MSEERSFRIGPIRPPSEAASLLLQVTQGCTWNKCKFCNIYRDTKFKAYSAESIRRDIDNIAYWAQRVQKHRLDPAGRAMENRPMGDPSTGDHTMEDGYSYLSGCPRWDIAGINAELQSMTDEDDRQSYYTVANWLLAGGENVFLQDGNSTVLSSGRLSDVLLYLRQTFPQIRRITSYGRAENLARLDAKAFAELKAAGLDRIHSGYETGSDEVLKRINKGLTQEQQITAGRAVKAGGIELSIYFMPGIGGKELSEDNAVQTAAVINAVDPDFLRIRTAAIKPGTEMYGIFFPERAGEAGLETGPDAAGPHTLCSDDDKVREIRKVIELAEGISTRIVSDHMVNLLQDVKGLMCSPNGAGSKGAAGQTGAGQTGVDPCKAALFAQIDRYLNLPETDRRIFQLLRRSLRAYDLDDMEILLQDGVYSLREEVMRYTDREWDEKMNDYISRYI